jgi:hypothetical protein
LLLLDADEHRPEPVWRQLLWHHIDHPDPDVAQQAATALAELK